VAATPSVKIVKQTNYRGSPKLWSNRYHFNGGTPANTAAWNALLDAIVLAEKAIYTTNTSIVHGWCYAAGSDVPVNDKAYTTAGTGSFAGGNPTTLEAAALIRYATTARSSKNHPVYLFNYMHGAYDWGSSAYDELNHNQKTAIETYATAWISGFSDGTLTLVRAGPNGATATARVVEQFLSHRDFPR
jgi:hypothetical protein